jgi:tetratricopeptide (TPR) repeat protein
MSHEAHSGDEHEEALSGVICDYLHALEAGRRPDRQALLAAHPGLANDLAEFFAAHDQLGHAAAPLRHAVRVSAGPRSPNGKAALPDWPAAADHTGHLAGVLAEVGRLGDFQIVREVGRGGMGIVYEAVQLSLNRRVALKVLPFAGGLEPKQLQRFKNESQAAAHLQHQHIVPVYFVGCERGVHFYAMQYIDGQTLAQLIAELRRSAGDEPARAPTDRPPSAEAPAAAVDRLAPPLPLAGEPTSPYGLGPMLPGPVPRAADTAAQAGLATERSHRTAGYFKAVARLGVQAAQALHHAHEMGVVHRDVKPGNLMVDGRGNVWVTDFGLARMQTEASLTLSGDLVGTVRYMSPEQALANRVVIDHRTDIYSLGATLYELLVLQAAFAGSDRQELLRRIAFDEPVPLRRLNKAVPAELETVVLKALEKRPEDRYATAKELADDLERFLKHEPVRARRPTITQRLRKWCRRHKAMVTVAAVAAVALLLTVTAALAIGLAAVEQERQRTQQERDQAEKARQAADEQATIAREVTEFLQNDLLGQASSWAQADRKFTAEPNLTVRQVLDRAAKRIGDRFHKRPLLEAAIRQVIGQAYVRVGKAVTARSHLQRSLDLRLTTLGPNHADTLNSMNDLAVAYLEAGQPGKALALHEPILARRKATLGRQHPETLASMNNLANAYLDAGQPAKALAIHRQVLLKRRAALGLDHPDTLSSMNNLANAYKDAGQLAKALALYRDVLAKRKKKLGLDHPDTLSSMNNLANADKDAGRLDKALALYEEVVAKGKVTLGPNHPDTLSSMNNLAIAYKVAGQLDKAVVLHEQALMKQKVALGPNHPHTLFSMNNLATAYGEAGQLDKAIGVLVEVIRLKKDNAEAHSNLANALRVKGRLDEAIAECRQAINLKKDYPEAHLRLGNALRDKGRLDEAIAECRLAIHLRKDYAEAHCNLGNALREKGRLDEAVTEYRQAIGTKREFPVAHKARNGLGLVLMDKGRLDEAMAEFREAIRLKNHYLQAHVNLGACLYLKGCLDQGIAEFRLAIRIKSDDAISHYNLGKALHDKGRLEAAIAEYREATRFKKDYAKAHCNLASALLDKGRLDEAIRECREAIRLNNKLPEAYCNLANALREKGRLAEAIVEYRQSIRLKKDAAVAHLGLGNALRDKGQLEEAIGSFRKAIHWKPHFAEAHCNLGEILARKGQFREALEECRRGHELGSRNPRWPYPSAQWVRYYKRLVELDDKLSAVLSGQKQPADTAECLAFAQLCQMPCKMRYAAAARFYSAAFAAELKLADDLKAAHRHNAACAAALAGCRQGNDAKTLGAKERGRLRYQALAWLRDDLKAWRMLLKTRPDKTQKVLAGQMQQWLKDVDFAGVRDERALARLPQDERQAWSALWTDVEHLRLTALGKPGLQPKSAKKP